MAGTSTSGGYQAVGADDTPSAVQEDVAKKVLEPDIPGHNELFNEENVSPRLASTSSPYPPVGRESLGANLYRFRYFCLMSHLSRALSLGENGCCR